jgi:hypothetical protein
MTKETTHARVEVKASGPAGTSSASDTTEDATAAKINRELLSKLEGLRQ